ncbi:hypothetical protein [Elioraea sp.]|uniref:hypothetical protein n=1 Tax=Elioraea sp. TaxID=2185103 RepID=UPI0025C21D58|nr:hypothetical protein [Elioraea sp.]
MNETTAETLAALWRLSRAEADDLRARIALLERAVMRAMGGQAVPGGDDDWSAILVAEERAAKAAAARTARIVELLSGRAA